MRKSTSGNNILQPNKWSCDYEQQNQTNVSTIFNNDIDYWQIKMYKNKLIKKKQTIDIYRQELDIKYKEHRDKILKKKQNNLKVLENLKFLIVKEKQYNCKLAVQIDGLEDRDRSEIGFVTVSGPSFQKDLESVSFSFCG